MVNEFRYLRAHAVEPLATFLDYITYGYMIDNIVLLLTGTLHKRDTRELIEKCHPLGVFDSMATLCVATSTHDLFNSVLIDTPLGMFPFGFFLVRFPSLAPSHSIVTLPAPYFSNCLSVEDLDEMHIEVIRNLLYKAYLEDFYALCEKLGGVTFDVMGPILQVREAQGRVLFVFVSITTGLVSCIFSAPPQLCDPFFMIV